MNKKQLVAKLSDKLNQSKADAERTFDTITNTILDALKNDDSVKIAPNRCLSKGKILTSKST